VQQIRPSDLEGPDSRERFLAGLPSELFGHIGGNTTCLEVEGSEQDVLVVDGGTGLRDLGLSHESRGNARHYHVFLTHFHWDHIQGIPFFPGLSNPRNRVTFYSTVKGFETLIRGQMTEPFFPVPLTVFPAHVSFVELEGQGPRVIAGTQVRWKSVNHPGSCVSYRFDRRGRSLIFSTDTELRLEDFARTQDNLTFYENADVLVLDAQYTLAEAVERPDWGHSSSSVAVDFALDFGVRTLYLFHHEPDHDDASVEAIGRAAQWYSDHKKPGALTVKLAREGRGGEV
jgi:phosphoribosyl 1,2-cyclic phosphodiesterase